MYRQHVEFPDWLEMLEKFAADQLEESKPQDGYYVYSIQCDDRIKIKIYFWEFEQAVATDLLVNGREVCENYMEGCEWVHFDDRTTVATLLGSFVHKNGKTQLKIVAQPEPLIEWRTYATSD